MSDCTCNCCVLQAIKKCDLSALTLIWEKGLYQAGDLVFYRGKFWIATRNISEDQACLEPGKPESKNFWTAYNCLIQEIKPFFLSSPDQLIKIHQMVWFNCDFWIALVEGTFERLGEPNDKNSFWRRFDTNPVIPRIGQQRLFPSEVSETENYLDGSISYYYNGQPTFICVQFTTMTTDVTYLMGGPHNIGTLTCANFFCEDPIPSGVATIPADAFNNENGEDLGSVITITYTPEADPQDGGIVTYTVNLGKQLPSNTSVIGKFSLEDFIKNNNLIPFTKNCPM